MTATLAFLRANPGLTITSLLIVMGALVLGLVGFIMVRSGASLRPIVFLAGFFAIVVLPQALFHAAQAFAWIPKRDLTWTPMSGETRAAVRYAVRESLLATRDGKLVDPAAAFGASYDPSLVSDLRERMPGGPFADAQVAQMAVVPPSSTTVVALFDQEAAAQRAGEQYAVMMLGSLPDVGPDGTRTVARTSDVVKLLVAGRAVLAWSAADAAAVERAFSDSPLLERVEPDAARPPAPDPAADFWLYRPIVLVSLTLVLLACAVVWFFRMSAWASEVPALPGTSPLEESALRQRLLAINALDVPFSVTPEPGDTAQLVVTWRYADAKWVDLARVRGMRRTHRILLRFDAANATVRPVDQQARYDWSVGAGGASLEWFTGRGVTFFQTESGREFGVQLDANGRFTPKLSYTYTFNLQEMKAPFIRAVTQAGWRWRPTMLDGPPWLHWLTH